MTEGELVTAGPKKNLLCILFKWARRDKLDASGTGSYNASRYLMQVKLELQMAVFTGPGL